MCFREKIDTGYRISQIFMEFYEIIFKGGQCDDVLFMYVVLKQSNACCD